MPPFLAVLLLKQDTDSLCFCSPWISLSLFLSFLQPREIAWIWESSSTLLTISSSMPRILSLKFKSQKGLYILFSIFSCPTPESISTQSVICLNQFSSVAQSCLTPCDPMNHSTPGLPVHHQFPEFTQTHVHWVGDAIQPSHPLSFPFSSGPQSLPASGSFPMSHLFTWGVQSTGVSALASVLPMNTQDWSPLGWTGWISLQSKGLSRVFSNTIVQKHQFFSAQLSSPSNSHIHTWPLEKPSPWPDGPLLAK